MYRFCLIILLIASYQLCLGQSSIRLNLNSYIICEESALTCSFEASENFSSLKLQLKYSITNDLVDIPFQREGSKIRFTIPSSIKRPNERYYYLRLVNTNPYVEGEWSISFDIGRLPELRLSSLTPSSANLYAPVKINFSGSGTFPIRATLSDSSKFTLDYGDDNGFNTSLSFIPKAEGIFRIASVTNACGAGKSSGEASYKNNAISIKTTQVSPQRVCTGMPIYVDFSTMSGNFSTNNKFKIRLLPTSANANLKSVELDAVLENAYLKAIIPSDLSLETSEGEMKVGVYNVQVISSSPVSEGDPNQVPLYVFPATTFKAEVSPYSLSQYALAERSIDVTFRGISPFKVAFSDGTSYTTFTEDYWGVFEVNKGLITKKVTPATTTSYTITEIQSGCGTIKGNLAEINIPVTPSLAISQFEKKSRVYCEGEIVKLKLSNHIQLPSSTQYFVSINGSWPEQVVKTVPAQLNSDGFLSFSMPVFTDVNASFYESTYLLQVTSVNPTYAGQTSPEYIRIQKKVIPKINNVSLSYPDAATLYIEPQGGRIDFLCTFSDGYTTTSPYREVFPVQNTTYTITSAQNICGKSENLNISATVEVKNVPDVYIILENQNNTPLCVQSEVEFRFSTKGNFLSGNEFILQNREYDGSWKNTIYKTTTDARTIKFKGKVSTPYRLVSTNPVIVSNTINPPFKDVPNVKIAKPQPLSDTRIYRSSVDNTYWIPGEDLNLGVSIQDADEDTEVILTDGTENHVLTFNNNYFKTTIPAPDKDRIYRVSSARNVCGTAQVNDEFKYSVLPFRIYNSLLNIGSFSGTSYQFEGCTGTNLIVPFTTQGLTNATPKYILQIASLKDSVFTNLATTTQSPFNTQIPANLSSGLYFLRIIAENPASRSAYMTLYVKTSPSATLTSTQSFNTYFGGSVYLPIQLTGTAPWYVVYNDLSDQTFSYSPNYKEFSLTKGTTYSLKTVSNICGYGPVSGEINVYIQRSFYLDLPTNDYQKCSGQSFPVRYSITGDFAEQEKISFDLYSSTNQKISTLYSFTYTQPVINKIQNLTLPSSLPAGSYRIELKGLISEEKAQTYLQIQGKPEVSISGDAQINPEGEAYLRIANTKTYEYGTYTENLTVLLSDGTLFKDLAIPGGSWQDVKVKPTHTTTYTITKVENNCLAGIGTGSAIITVNPFSDRQTAVTKLEGIRSYTICQGDSILVHYETKGNFSNSNRFTVEIYNSSGKSYSPLATIGTSSPLKALLPVNLPVSASYLIRVTGTDANIQAATNNRAFTLGRTATASFDQQTVFFKSGEATKLNLKLTGDAPWQIRIGDGGYPGFGQFFKIDSLPAFISVQPTSALTVYTLHSVSNGCGVGTILSPSQVRFEFITSVTPEPQGVFTTYPNPSPDWVRVSFPVPDAFRIQLYNALGQLLHVQSGQGLTLDYSLKNLSSGTYILRASQGKQTYQVKIIRN